MNQGQFTITHHRELSVFVRKVPHSRSKLKNRVLCFLFYSLQSSVIHLFFSLIIIIIFLCAIVHVVFQIFVSFNLLLNSFSAQENWEMDDENLYMASERTRSKAHHYDRPPLLLLLLLLPYSLFFLFSNASTICELFFYKISKQLDWSFLSTSRIRR